MASDGSVLLVQAQYVYSGKNNDELCFKKGDLITVTQKEDGGWWEGTLEDKTGWFPSNYVKEYKPQDGSKSPISLGGGCGSEASSTAVTPDPLSPQSSQQHKLYRNIVVHEIVDTERNHVTELQTILTTYLHVLQKSDILTDVEYKQLVGNLEDVVSVHLRLLTALNEQMDRPPREQRIAGVIMNLLPKMQSSHKTYCTNHPKAVCMLEKYKDELSVFMESQGSKSPGIMILTTALSKPFRRLDKYTGLLQEYQRHMEEGHPDRGDTQRTSHILRELATTCGSIRRQKELELEVVTGRVHGWDGGETLGILGDLVHMGSVALMPDHRDHYLVLFPSALILLGVSPRMSAFTFKGKYLLPSIQINLLDDGDNHKNAFQVTSPKMDRITAVCQTKEDQQQWVEILQQQCSSARTTCNFVKSSTHTSPPLPPHTGPILQRQNSTISNGRGLCGNKKLGLSCLRPSPPLHPGLPLSREDKKGPRHAKKKDEKWHEDDTLILRVIEAYCTSSKTRLTVNSTVVDNPQVLIPAEEKMIVEEQRGDQVVIWEKTLVDTVYDLKEQFNSLKKQHQYLHQQFENEKFLSSRMRNIMKQLTMGRSDINWDLDT